MNARRLLVAALLAPSLWAQFSSGSNGSDGALNLTTPGTVVFDPVALGLDLDGDNVFHFTTINIASGVTLKVRASRLRSPNGMVWLATGNVTIAGGLDVSGEKGYDSTPAAATLSSTRRSADPGPGGYPGGLGSRYSVGPESGAGPGGGPAGTQGCSDIGSPYGSSIHATCGGGWASHKTLGSLRNNGVTYGNFLLVPLAGGSGGGGGWGAAASDIGGGGGAGGGAIRIASTTQIQLTGQVWANGGDSGRGTGGTTGANNRGGPGAGGAIHLIAPTVLGTGTLQAAGGTENYAGFRGGEGYIRISATTNSYTGSSTPAHIAGALFMPPLPSGLPLLRITSINGNSVPSPAYGDYLAPDLVVNSGTPLSVAIAASNIPTGTVVKLRVTAEESGDQLINCAALAGTVASSTASCGPVTFPFAVSFNSLRATW